MARTGKPTETENRFIVGRGWEEVEMESDCLTVLCFFLIDENVLELDSSDDCTAL